jgi:phosphorylcholine metabolism protein LicD
MRLVASCQFLRELVRSYLLTMNSYGVETWIALGTLLGWWWNDQIMPWDYDIDVQVSENTLQWIGDNLNSTEHSWNYTETATEEFISKRYFLDINHHHSDIDSSDRKNIIDGRWIDMHNGMYVDTTGIREREVDRPGVWTSKNKHRYESQDLWPMRITEFEGVGARVPFNFNKILVDEYGTKSLVTESWAGYVAFISCFPASCYPVMMGFVR